MNPDERGARGREEMDAALRKLLGFNPDAPEGLADAADAHPGRLLRAAERQTYHWLGQMPPEAARELGQQADDEFERVIAAFPLPAGGPLAAAHALVEQVMREFPREPTFVEWYQTAAGRRILALPPRDRVAVVQAALERAVHGAPPPESVTLLSPAAIPGSIAGDLLESGLPLDTGDRVRILETLLAATPDSFRLPLREAVPRIAEGFGEPGADDVLRPGALRLRKRLVPEAFHDARKRELTCALERALLGGRTPFLDVFEPWAARVVDEVEAMPQPERGAWMRLLEHVIALSSARPSTRWTRTARERVTEVGREAFVGRVEGWIAAMHDEPDEPLSARNGDLARGLAWCLAGEGGEREVRIVGELALSCAARIPEVGQRSAKTANACIAALGETMSEGATAQLTRLLAAIEYPQARALIEKALQSAAARRGGAVPDAAATRGPGA